MTPEQYLFQIIQEQLFLSFHLSNTQTKLWFIVGLFLLIAEEDQIEWKFSGSGPGKPRQLSGGRKSFLRRSKKRRWVIEGQGAWEGRGIGLGQVAAGVHRPHPAGQPARHCSRRSILFTIAQIYERNRRLPFCAVHCHHDSRAEVAPLWGLGGAVGETINCSEGTNWGRWFTTEARGAGFNRLLAGTGNANVVWRQKSPATQNHVRCLQLQLTPLWFQGPFNRGAIRSC